MRSAGEVRETEWETGPWSRLIAGDIEGGGADGGAKGDRARHKKMGRRFKDIPFG